MPEFYIQQPNKVANTSPAITVGESIIEKTKSPYTEGQNLSAGFAYRMENANKILNQIEDSGFNPVNLKDFGLQNFPLIGGSFITRFMLSPKFKQYDVAKIDFSTAQLRKETGAVINDSEIDWINQTYFPMIGDDETTISVKRANREKAILAMKSNAGAAYDMIIKEAGSPQDEATKELIERAKNNPQLKSILIERGIIKDE